MLDHLVKYSIAPVQLPLIATMLFASAVNSAAPSWPEASRAFADGLSTSLSAGDYSAIRSRMGKAFREAASEEEFHRQLANLAAQYGKLLSYEYKMVEVSSTADSGQKLPTRRFWYAVTTTKYARGKYFLFIDVVVEDDHLACSGLSFVTFPGGPPTELQ